VTSVIAFGDRALVAAKGGGAILAIDDRDGEA